MNQGTTLKPYKGYTGNIKLDFENKVYYGYVQDIPMEMIYDADTLEDLQSEFEQCVDEYMRISGIAIQMDYINRKDSTIQDAEEKPTVGITWN